MSTKSGLVYGHDFYLFKEAFEDDGLYLKLEGSDFIAIPGCVTVKIPLAVWEVIRHYTLPDAAMDLADLDDDALEALVKAEVQKRTKGDARGLLMFGSTNNGEAQQIAMGLKWYKRKRDEQQTLRKQIEGYLTNKD